MTDHEITTLTFKAVVAWLLLAFGSLTLHDVLSNLALLGSVCLTFYTLYKQVKGDKAKPPPDL